MNCALTDKQQKQFFIKIYKDLQKVQNSSEDFALNDFIKNIYNLVLKATEDEVLALNYAQITPEFIDLALTGKRDLIKSLRSKGLDYNNLLDTIELFEDITHVEDIVTIKITEEDITSTVESAIDAHKQDTLIEPPTQDKQIEAENEVKNLFDGKPTTGFTSTGQEGTYTDGALYDDKNPEEVFYYEFFDVISNAMREQAATPEEVVINGHKGFKLKLISKSQLPLDQARTDEQELYANKTVIRDGKTGEDLYNEGVGLIVTDLEGNILKFDNEYNVTEEGKPLYHNIRKPVFENGKYSLKRAKLQSIEDLVRNHARLLYPSMNFTSFKKHHSFQYEDLKEKFTNQRQAQLKMLADIRKYLTENPKEAIEASINSVSIGILPIDEGSSTEINSINWDQSDVKYAITINDTEGGLPGLGEAQGGVYIRIPGYRSIPLQRKNISQEHIDSITSLIFDDVKVERDGIKTNVTASERKDLIESILITNEESVQIIVNDENGTYKVNVAGKGVNFNNPTTVEEARTKVKEILSTPYKKGSRFNNKYGQYRIKKSTTGNVIDFKVQDNVLTTESLNLNDYVAKYATMKIKPAKTKDGKNNILSFLNGYFTFDIPLDQQQKLKSKEIVENISPKTKSLLGRSLTEGDSLYADTTISMKNSPTEIKKAKEWFENSPLAEHIEFKEMFDIVNSNAWAEFKDSTIKLYSGANHTVLYHEAWHAFSQLYLPSEDRARLYHEVRATKEGIDAINKLAKKLNTQTYALSDAQTALAIEELIAEGFREYVLSDGKKVLKGKPVQDTIFKKILRFLRDMLISLYGGVQVDGTGYIKLTELYNKLYVGKITEYDVSTDNVLFKDSALYSKYEPVTDQESEITDQEALLLSESIDSIMSSIIDEQNQLAGNSKFTNALFTQPNKYLPLVYNGVKEILERRKDELEILSEELEGLEKERAEKNIRILKDGIANFGLNSDIVKGSEGLVAYHLDKSPFLEEIEDDSFAVKTNNEFKSIQDQADVQIKYLLKSLKEYKGDNEVVNRLGFPKLVPFTKSWKAIMKVTTDNNSGPADMLKALSSESITNKSFKDLINKLGPVNTEFHSTFDLWTAFWSTFNFAKQPLLQVSVVETIDPETNEKIFEVKAGQASAVFRQVEREFSSFFKTVKDHPFIIDTRKFGNKLDYSVLDKYKSGINTVSDKFNFLNDIGIPLTKNSETIKGLNSVRVDYLYNKLKKLNFYKIPVTDVIQALRDNQEITDSSGKNVNLKSESTNVNAILNLEVRYSGNYSNVGVSTPEGNTKYEEVLMSSLGNIMREINTVSSFDELIRKDHMKHLSYDLNPNITSSSMMKSLFEFNDITQTFGKRKQDVRFQVADLGGTQNITIDSADYNYSVTTAQSDGYTRLLQDIYSGLMLGKFSNITPSDKSTILSTTVSEINSGVNSGSKNLYVDIADFNKKGYKHTKAIHSAYELLLPYLGGELARISKVKEHQKTGNTLSNIPGYTVPDSKGNIRGLDFTIFDDILNANSTDKTLKKDLLEAGSLSKIKESPELQQRILDAVNKYFIWSSAQTRQTLGDKLLFVDKNIKSIIEKEVGRKLTKDKVADIMIKSYTVNSFIHHVENFTILYGDLAQYKDISKRNYGIQSTGLMFRTDQEAYDYVNQVLGRPFEEKFKGSSDIKSFDGSLDTLIMEEITVPSVMVGVNEDGSYRSYTEAIIKDLISKGFSEKDAIEKEKKINNEYYSMDEADAQGYINFDTYRILGKLNNSWTMEQESLFNKILTNPENINMKDISEYFPPRKYQYFGPVATKGLAATAFHKYSLFPLIPTAIKGTNLEALQETMFKQGIDYATYDSGSKVSTITAPGKTSGEEIYSDLSNRIFKERGESSEDQLVKNKVFIHYLKDQLKINSHYKGKVIFSTQLRTLIEEGLIENGIPTDFKKGETLDKRLKAWSKLKTESDRKKASIFYSMFKTYEQKIGKLIEFRKEQLRFEVGLKDNKSDLTKLISFVGTELSRQDLADHEIDFIKVDSSGKMIYDLSVSPSAAKIEKTLNAIVNNRLVRQKVKGEALVQLASTMLEPRKATETEKKKYSTNDLRSYRKDPKTGKTLPMDVKVSLQGDFKNLINLKHKDGDIIAVYSTRTTESPDGKIKTIKEFNQAKTLERLNETIQDEEWRSQEGNMDYITMVGVRIPVQGLNSMENMAVWEFLPEETGNILVPPSEMVGKSGSDFDIDKLTIMMPTVSMIGSTPVVIKDIDNGKSHTENINRINDIKSDIKETRNEIKDVRDKYSKEFKNLGDTITLTEEEETLKNELFTPFIEDLKKVNKLIRDLEFNNERLHNYEVLTFTQQELLDSVIDQLEEADDEKERLEAEFDKTKKEFGEKIRNSKYQEKLEQFEKRRDRELNPLNKKLEKLEKEKIEIGDKSIQNSLMFGIRDILELPDNFVSLITPNDTSLFTDKGGIVEELSGNREYDSRNGLQGFYGKMSPTRVLEPSYNVDVHSRNSVGKQVLGLGANANVFNVMLNRIGMTLNPEYKTRKGKKRRAQVLLDHHKTSEGLISLSNEYGLDGTKIADVINQLMNGWVDVAKDAWIFDIQGNLEVTPSLLFLIMSGVPYKQAIYFVSNPIVKEYVKEQKIIKSAFAKATGQSAEEKYYAANKAKYNIFKKLGFYSVLDPKRESVKKDKLYEITLNITEKANLDKHSRRISKLSFEQSIDDFTAKAGFLHFLEIEEMAKKLENFRRAVKLDTVKNTTLFDAQLKEADIRILSEDALFDTKHLVKAFEETATGKFRVGPFQNELWSGLFKLRNHPEINEYLISKLSDFTQSTKIEKMFGNKEKYVEEFKNDFIIYNFLKTLRDYDISSGSYKGVLVDESIETLKADQINRGVVVTTKDGKPKIHIDKKALNIQFKANLYLPQEKSSLVSNLYSYESLGLSPLDKAFNNTESGKKEFYKFSIEREYQRLANPFSEMSKTSFFKNRVKTRQRSLEYLEDETKEEFTKRLLQVTYEDILRDRALDNVLNEWKVFKSRSSIADQIMELKSLHPSLEEDYSIISDLIISDTKSIKGETVKNLILKDHKVSKDQLEIYHQNILELIDPTVNSIPITEETTESDYIENNRIAELFSILTYSAYIQSGLNSSDRNSLIRIMPQEIVGDVINQIKESLLEKIDEDYINDYRNKFNVQNSKGNISLRRRLKSYSGFEYIQDDSRPMISDVNPSIVLPTAFSNEFNEIRTGQRTGTTRSPEHIFSLQKGDVIEFESTKYSGKNSWYKNTIYARVTNDPVLVSDMTEEEWAASENKKQGYSKAIETGKMHVQFELISLEDSDIYNEFEKFKTIEPDSKKELESMIENNPSVTFITEGTRDGIPIYDGKKLKEFDNIVSIPVKNKLRGVNQELTDEILDEVSVDIQSSIEKIKDLIDNSSTKVVFLVPRLGYGSQLFGTKTFDYISEELYEKIGYTNTYSKFSSLQDVIKQNQDFNEFDLSIPAEELFDAEQRLKCK